jgi:hypothetical protein
MPFFVRNENFASAFCCLFDINFRLTEAGVFYVPQLIRIAGKNFLANSSGDKHETLGV